MAEAQLERHPGTPWTVRLFERVPAGALILILAVAVATLLLPVVGVHRCILETKQTELEQVRAEIRSEHDAMLQPRGASGASDVRLSNLIAYETRIASVNTWPLDVSTLLRFSFYVALGVGSWLGGAMVERLLGVALD